MIHPLHQYVGRSVADVPTPVLVLDLDVFDRNAGLISAELRDCGVDWRPHAKAHGNAVLAKRQIELGAIGVTCATVTEAAVLTQGGVPRILIANELATPHATDWAAVLQRTAEVIVCVDSDLGRDLLAQSAAVAGTEVPVLIEVDIGMARAGLHSGPELVRLAAAVTRTPGLRLEGVMGYEGHTLDLQPPERKAAEIEAAIAALLKARDDLRASGFMIETVSCGGTGSYRISSRIPGVTEIQAGGGCFNDRFYMEACGVSWLEPALTIHGTVTSRPSPDYAIVDAGMKSMSMSDGAPLPQVEGATVTALYAEHGKLAVTGPARDLQVGDRVRFIPGYSDSTTMLHGGFVGVRNGVVDAILLRPTRWPA
jgi:D-serine deaminase-like pyridoxal phosphate-dependent protein